MLLFRIVVISLYEKYRHLHTCDDHKFTSQKPCSTIILQSSSISSSTHVINLGSFLHHLHINSISTLPVLSALLINTSQSSRKATIPGSTNQPIEHVTSPTHLPIVQILRSSSHNVGFHFPGVYLPTYSPCLSLASQAIWHASISISIFISMSVHAFYPLHPSIFNIHD